MQYPVLIEPIGEDRYRGTTGMPLSLTAEAATREEVLAKLGTARK